MPGITLNLSKTGDSVSFGGRGAKVTVGPKGTRATVGIPGTGLSYTQASSQNTPSSPDGQETAKGTNRGALIILSLVLLGVLFVFIMSVFSS